MMDVFLMNNGNLRGSKFTNKIILGLGNHFWLLKLKPALESLESFLESVIF